MERPKRGKGAQGEGGFVAVLVTAPDAATATAVGTALVEERLAACANVVPGLVSIFRWEGKVHGDPEVLLVIKTRAALFPALEARVRALHPYQVPEIVALPILAGSAPYLRWLAEETAKPRDARGAGGAAKRR